MLSVKSKTHIGRKTHTHTHTHKVKPLINTNSFIKGNFYHIASENPPVSFDGIFVKYLGKKAVFEKIGVFQKNKDTITKDDFQSAKKEVSLKNKKNFTQDSDEIFLHTTTTQMVNLDHIINVEKMIDITDYIIDVGLGDYANKPLEFTY